MAAILTQNRRPEAKLAVFKPILPKKPLAIPPLLWYQAGKFGRARTRDPPEN